MNIEELKVERIRLEASLAALIDGKLSEFKERTGVSITNISIRMARIDRLGCEVEHVVDAVRADIEI